MAEDQDWRLKAELDVPDTRSALDQLLGRVRGPDVVRDVGAAVAHDVAITHDGKLLFAYAASEPSLASARSAIESALRQDGVKALIFVSHWDDEFDEWRQTDPPLSGEAKQSDDAAHRAAAALETRTMIASSGREIRAEFEQIMVNWAQKLGLKYEVIEHPHLLTSQVAFTVTGSKHKIDEFAKGLRAEELASMRTERSVMRGAL